MQRFEKVVPPPGRQQLAEEELWPRIQAEARRQLQRFYPVLDKDTESRVLSALQRGIHAMWSRGAARISEGGSVLFWNPVEGAYQCYDQEYNRLMVDFLGDFRKRAS